MAARGSLTGLTTQDLNEIRTTLASGRKPKVVFTEAAGQIAGQAGQVVALRDPADDEWVVVRFGRDELPFSPVDLAVPPRGSAKRTPARRATPPAEARAAADPPVAAGPSAARTPTDSTTSASSAAIPPQRQEKPMPSTQSSTVDTAASTTRTPPAAEAPASDRERPPRKVSAPRQPKVKAPPSLTVTLSYTDGDWFVGAQQGSKSLAKPYVIKAGEALRMVGLLDVPGVHEAVEQIIAAERAEANAHAERLRTELAEIEARLADLPKLT
jgi:hypothetical protein